MRYSPLGSTGLQVSQIGFGAAPLGEDYGGFDLDEFGRAIHYALDQGVNLIDVAPYYGRTVAETRLGSILQGRRHEVILSTKCARYDIDGFDFSAAGVRRMVDESLLRLRTDHVDIMHVHDVEFGCFRQIVEETIPQLRKLQQAGKLRFIGISGLALKMLRDIAAATPVDCVLSYCRYNLLNRDMDQVLTPLIREKDIGLINASPLHMRCLAEGGPPKWHPAPSAVKDAAHNVVDFCRSRGLSAPRVALQFAVQHPIVACTLVGMSSVAEVQENLQAVNAWPDPDILRHIDAIVAPVQGMAWITGFAENH